MIIISYNFIQISDQSGTHPFFSLLKRLKSKFKDSSDSHIFSTDVQRGVQLGTLRGQFEELQRLHLHLNSRGVGRVREKYPTGMGLEERKSMVDMLEPHKQVS